MVKLLIAGVVSWVLIIMAILTLTGCVTFSPETFVSTVEAKPLTCEDYGVVVTHEPAGAILVEEAVSYDLLQELCEKDYPVRGCMIHYRGLLRLYWLEGDEFARKHEKCHALNGRGHVI